MLKVVSNFVNAIGAVNYKGTWNASTNNPALASGVGVKGDYYVVSTAGTTTIDGISTWYVGDWIVFNGAAWQRVQGGSDDPAPSLLSNSSTGLMQITGPAAGQTRVVTIPDANATMARTDSAQSFTGDQTLSTGNLVIGTAGKGIDFSADPSAPGMTSELFDDYEEGTFTPVVEGSTTAGTATYDFQSGKYTKVGRLVSISLFVSYNSGTGTGDLIVTGLPFTNAGGTESYSAMTVGRIDNIALTANNVMTAYVQSSSNEIRVSQYPVGGGAADQVAYDAAGALMFTGVYMV